MKNNVRKLAYFFIGIFCVLLLYLGYLNAVVGPSLAGDPHNRRLAEAEKKTARGTIFDRQLTVLAKDDKTQDGSRRVYPRGAETSHLLGFVSERYGRNGLESAYDRYLLGLDDRGKLQALLDRLLSREHYGYDVVLTLDSGLQAKAYKLLAGRRGAVVALEPSTGAVLVMASTPGFDTNTMEDIVSGAGDKKLTRYDLLQRDSQGAPLLNRATYGLYAPGSVFKVITAAGALKNLPERANQKFECTGSYYVDGFTLKDIKVHGQVGFNDAIALSCNSDFADMGLALGDQGLREAAGAFGFQAVDFGSGAKVRYPVLRAGDIDYYPGILQKDKMSKTELASTAIGQGKTLVSPLQMAMVAAGVANGGTVMLPHLLGEVRTRGGRIIESYKPAPLYSALEPELAAQITQAMVQTVTRGTGTAASLGKVAVAGKTGSAQNPQGQSHAWFIGFAPADNPVVAVAVVVENAGAGGGVSAPIAREIMSGALQGR